MKNIKLLVKIPLLVIIFSLTNSICNAKSPIKGPVFTEYGAVFKITDRNIPLAKDMKYKVLFDISKTGDDKTKLNKNIESVARFINMHVLNGVKLENIKIAVVLHGKATRDGLNNGAYETRYQTNNPTLDLIHQLKAKGVSFYQCGQSAYSQNVYTKDLDENVGMALSAMTMLTELQTQGYQLIPWW